jgi:hypothetical protein
LAQLPVVTDGQTLSDRQKAAENRSTFVCCAHGNDHKTNLAGLIKGSPVPMCFKLKFQDYKTLKLFKASYGKLFNSLQSFFDLL